jgi:hypothetical protein
MFKVSFIGDFKDVQVFNAKATVVTLTGRFDMPEWWNNIPDEVYDWVDTHPSVNVNESWGTGEVILDVQGKAVCHEDDTFNAIIGERIAESKAKFRIYKFMHNMCEMLMKHYYGVMYGNAEFDIIKESHTEEPKDCLFLTCIRYRELMIKESHHLGELLKEA